MDVVKQRKTIQMCALLEVQKKQMRQVWAMPVSRYYTVKPRELEM